VEAQSLIRGNASPKSGIVQCNRQFTVAFWGKYAVCMHKVGAGSRARRVRQLGVRVAFVPAISVGLGRHDVAVTRLFLTENVVGIDGIFA